MIRFTCNSGERPLDGYTIKRGIGRGGFGEVYFAVSDGGKEVALKLLRDNAATELRGVAQCLNLKHPNLVEIYDVRTDSRGESWIVMEHIAGDSLHLILGRHPGGLPVELAREWFMGLAKAVAYLHDHGIVHRDLKPGNIFLENVTIKVGDYGLSKAISSSQRTEQTRSIGTVHYMAPEISTGRYDKSVDLYAAGVIIYEMLTGRVPFDGESAGEVLMKHLTAPPDLGAVPGPLVPVVAKALSKDPAHRYASMAEFAQAVEQATGIAPVSVREVAAPTPPSPPAPVNSGLQLGEVCGALALTTVFAALATAFWAALMPGESMPDLGIVFFLTVATCWAVLLPSYFWQVSVEESWRRRVVMLLLGAGMGLHALWLEGWTLEEGMHGRDGGEAVIGVARGLPLRPSLREAASMISYFAIVFLALRWWKMTDRRRTLRFSVGPVLAAGFWALLLLLVWHDLGHAAVAVVAASAILQLVSPWEPLPPAPARRMRLRYVF